MSTCSTPISNLSSLGYGPPFPSYLSCFHHIGIFHWHNPSDCTMALGLTQSLTEMCTRNISWKVKAAGAYGWQPYHLYVLIVLKSGSLNLLETSGRVQGCHGTAKNSPWTHGALFQLPHLSPCPIFLFKLQLPPPKKKAVHSFFHPPHSTVKPLTYTAELSAFPPHAAW